MGKGNQASHCQSLPVTWVLFGCKPWEMGSGCTTGSSLAAMQEPCSCSHRRAGGMALPAAVPVHEKGDEEVWSEGPANLLLSHPCRCRVTCDSGNGC